MYKCSECGIEYKTAPKYCECGNDIFIPIEDIEPQEIDDDIFEEDDEIETIKHRNLKQKSYSPVSISIFVLSIILSLLVLFVFGNPKKNIVENVMKNNLSEKTEIPEIDSFWDNTPIKSKKLEEPEEQDEGIMNIMPKIVQEIIPIVTPEIKTDATIKKFPIKSEQKSKTKPITVQNTQNQKNTKTQTIQTKPSSQANSEQIMTFEDLTNKIRNQYYANQTQNNASNTNNQTSTATPTTHSSVQQNTANTNPTTTKITSAQSTTASPASVQTPPVANSQQANIPVVPEKSPAQLRQELTLYKSSLRNTIGKKIDFTKVIGDGECSLSFKISSNGRLTSKTFTKQSSNMTLNDTVFNALNTMTSFNPPPEGYKGETLRLNIKFYNGNFEISLN